jgi:UDP:flavonoid glycosyltransferase YjiC (YdhE family)
MKLQDIKQNFNQTELATIKKFLKYVNDTAQTDSDFANDSSLDQLNQFSAIAETDDDIRSNVREWLRLKKVRLRGNFTNN